jgi:hypothetical protein
MLRSMGNQCASSGRGSYSTQEDMPAPVFRLSEKPASVFSLRVTSSG